MASRRVWPARARVAQGQTVALKPRGSAASRVSCPPSVRPQTSPLRSRHNTRLLLVALDRMSAHTGRRSLTLLAHMRCLLPGLHRRTDTLVEIHRSYGSSPGSLALSRGRRPQLVGTAGGDFRPCRGCDSVDVLRLLLYRRTEDRRPVPPRKSMGFPEANMADHPSTVALDRCTRGFLCLPRRLLGGTPGIIVGVGVSSGLSVPVGALAVCRASVVTDREYSTAILVSSNASSVDLASASAVEPKAAKVAAELALPVATSRENRPAATAARRVATAAAVIHGSRFGFAESSFDFEPGSSSPALCSPTDLSCSIGPPLVKATFRFAAKFEGRNSRPPARSEGGLTNRREAHGSVRGRGRVGRLEHGVEGQRLDRIRSKYSQDAS